MARVRRDRRLMGRTDQDTGKEIDQYCEDAEMYLSELVEAAVIEYMKNHPVINKEEK